MIAATSAYRAQQDVLADFLADCCVIQPKTRSSKKEFYKAYVQSYRQALRKLPAKTRDIIAGGG